MRLDLEEGKRLLSEAAAGPWFIGPATDDTILAEDYAGCVVSRPLLDTFVEFWRAHPEDDPPMPIATDPLVANTYADNAAFGDDESHPHAKANVNAIVWLRNNADALVAAAEEAEKLRELLREARDVMDVARGNALLSDGEWLSDCIDAALTPPEPLSAQQETYT